MAGIGLMMHVAVYWLAVNLAVVGYLAVLYSRQRLLELHEMGKFNRSISAVSASEKTQQFQNLMHFGAGRGSK
ncbi:hypothetical protein [Silvibacterium dinghuense]|uniref:Uncharacterized protein n=1 Tax=Silvibacterium dinghuense TaxID=1560006 RepID=A0A4V1NV96_9BACT|nr:hypothetical protein [Silvibacterium dinghuense]RXS95000.1 hypothetical protein ESZ00_10235 [Silvibacterium dinghuense]GGH09743.1 hypothetical protein GCM10011586_27820 [Silvibacterium dinghuense]